MRENEGVTEPSGSPEPTTERATVQVRRAPKIPAFMVVGGLVGLLFIRPEHDRARLAAHATAVPLAGAAAARA